MKASNNAFQSPMATENSITGFMCDGPQKQRKLTVDSGYGDDFVDMKESEDSFARTSSLDSIGEDSLHVDDTIETDGAGHTTKKEKRRRMTPVPRALQIVKPSQITTSASEKRILFVEEEDYDDIEKYNYEDDFICPGLQSTTSRLTTKRNSWHGITEGEKFAKYHKGVSLSKSKSLDRGCDYPRRRKRLTDMNSVPSISFEELSLECKEPMVSKQQNFNEDFPRPKSNSFNGTQECNESESAMPAWMKTAAAEDEMPKDLRVCTEKKESREHEDGKNNDIFNKLQIPQIDLEKINADQNKTNRLLSEQRKILMREKNKASSRRRRKLTPSESPSHSSLEKLLTLRTASEELTVTEEEEEEDS